MSTEKFVICRECGKHLERITFSHLWNIHGLRPWQYLEKFPGASMCSGESGRRQSDSGLESYKSPDRKQAQHEMMVELWKDPHYREVTSKAVSEGKSGQPGHLPPTTEAYREHHREAALKDWASLTEKERRNRMKPLWGASIEAPNNTEAMLLRFLEKGFPGIFRYNYGGDLSIGEKCPDFVPSDGHKVVIESFGAHWHDPEYFDRLSEEELVAHYGRFGYTCIVVWADSPEDIICEWPNLANKIKEVLR